MRWIVPADQSFLWDDFESDALVFDALSGSTHYLNPPAAEALLALERHREGLETGQVRAHVLEALGLAADALAPRDVEELLAHLAQIGLVAPTEDHAPG
jgi:PqqD family protein of HPr-rel-A system